MLRRTIHRFAYAFALALCVAAAASAQQSQPASADALKPLQFLIGTWTAEGEMPGAGKYAMERSYRIDLSGKFLLATEVMRLSNLEITREMWLGLDPAKQSLAAWGFSSDGGYAILSGAQSTSEALVLEGRLIGGADSGVYRGTIQHSGGDRFTHTIDMQKDGAWTRYAAFNFTRSPSRSAVTPRATAPANPAAKLLDVLAGNWRADGESDGVKYAVDYSFYWTLGGHFLRSDYSVTTNGQTEFHAASYSFYDPESKSLVQFGFSADGTTLVSKIRPGAAAGSIVFDGAITSATRAAGLRVTYSRPDADTLSASTEMQRQDGTWRRSGASSFKRRP